MRLRNTLMKITVKEKYEEMVISKQYTNENKKKLKKNINQDF